MEANAKLKTILHGTAEVETPEYVEAAEHVETHEREESWQQQPIQGKWNEQYELHELEHGDDDVLYKR